MYMNNQLKTRDLPNSSIINTVTKRELEIAESDSVHHRAMPRNAWP